VAASVESHTLLFARVSEPEGPGLDDLRLAELDDHGRIVDFQVEQVGMPRDFLEGYVRERLERQEMLLFEESSQLLAVGELRRDLQQDGIAQLGLIVRAEERGQGIGTRMFSSLATRSRELGLTPCCSTEITEHRRPARDRARRLSRQPPRAARGVRALEDGAAEGVLDHGNDVQLDHRLARPVHISGRQFQPVKAGIRG
jgi:GNAT superfamily N-acetyltransferase